MSFFIGLLISLCCLHLAAAFPHANLPYQNVKARAGSKMVIPCDLTINGVFGHEKIDYEWGFTPDGSDRYRTIFRRNDIKLHPGMLHDRRMHLHPTHTTREDCSLVISPLLMEDSGTYEIHVIVNGARSGPIKKTNVHVTDSPLMTAGRKFGARRKAMVQLPEPMAIAEGEQTASVEEGQARPVEGGQAGPVEGGQAGPVEGGQAGPVEGGQAGPVEGGQAGPVEGGQAGPVEGGQAGPVEGGQARPVEGGQAGPVEGGQAGPVEGGQAGPVEGGQAGPVEKEQQELVDEGLTTGKKHKARHKAIVHSPVTTTIQMTTAAGEQTATAGKKTMGSAENNTKKLTFFHTPLIYVCLFGICIHIASRIINLLSHFGSIQEK